MKARGGVNLRANGGVFNLRGKKKGMGIRALRWGGENWGNADFDCRRDAFKKNPEKKKLNGGGGQREEMETGENDMPWVGGMMGEKEQGKKRGVQKEIKGGRGRWGLNQKKRKNELEGKGRGHLIAGWKMLT